MMRSARWLVAMVVLTACGSSPRSPVTPAVPEPVAPAPVAAPAPPAPPAPIPDEDLDSKDILARTDTAPIAYVKHVLIGWGELAPQYSGRLDPRAANRSNADAAKLAREVAGKLTANPDLIDELVNASSEDPGSLTGEPYAVKPDTGMVPEFKNLALRLHDREVGIVKTMFGYHVMLRVAPPTPDPLESADILARPKAEASVRLLHVVIGWKDTPVVKLGRGDPRAKDRSKADADSLARQVLAKARARGDMAALVKTYSEDTSQPNTAEPITLAADTKVPEPYEAFQKLALRLKVNEVGLVRSPLGWHVVKRLPPEPPDALESVAILGRKPVTEKAVVKHILLGWTATHADDERGKTRDRATLERLVKATVAKLHKGAKIEPLMDELSEDPGSAKSGEPYTATPDAGLVAPFKNLALRLKVGEVGVVKSDFGIHIIQRVE